MRTDHGARRHHRCTLHREVTAAVPLPTDVAVAAPTPRRRWHRRAVATLVISAAGLGVGGSLLARAEASSSALQSCTHAAGIFGPYGVAGTAGSISAGPQLACGPAGRSPVD